MKKITAFILLIAFMIVLFPTMPVHAESVAQIPVNKGWARIRYAGSGRYLDVPTEGIDDNGTQLQIWDKAYGNQNQIFYFEDTGDGWHILSHMSGKLIEVRDSSHEDYAQVAQWDVHNLDCACWYIISNNDGTVSFRNKESGLYLNVYGGGNAENGTKIIQYHNDGSVAMKFYLEIMTYEDILSATFTRNIKNNEIEWTEYRPFIGSTTNHTDWQYESNGKYYHPTPNQGLIFSTAEFLSPNTVANMLRDKAYNQKTWNQIKDALEGELSEDAISELLSKLGFSTPGLGYALGILQVLWDSQDAEKWNSFVDVAQIDSRGRCSGVIVYTYYEIVRYSIYGPLNNGTTAWGTTYCIKEIPYVEYKAWTGDNFYNVCKLPINNIDGEWWYHFK